MTDPAETSLASAAAAVGRLRDAIEFGRSVEHPGLADVVGRAGYAVAGLRDVMGPMLHDAARAVARGEAPAPGAVFAVDYERVVANVRAAQRFHPAAVSGPGSSR